MNILIKRTAALGDVLLATSVLPFISKKYPQCKIFFQTQCPEVVKNNNHIFKILSKDATFDENFDLIFDLDFSYENKPNISIFKAYSETIGCNDDELKFDYIPSPESINKCLTIFHEKQLDFHNVIAIQSSANFWSRNIHPNALNSIVKIFKEKYSLTFIHLGGINDSKIEGAVDLRGIGDISLSAALLSKCNGFIGIDSTLLHFAKALKIPVAAFFGPTNPKLRIKIDACDLILTSNLDCKFCHHRQKPPALITICSRNYFSVIFDNLYQKVLFSYQQKNNNIDFFLIRIFSKLLRFREKGRIISHCMNNLLKQDIESLFNTWLKENVLPKS